MTGRFVSFFHIRTVIIIILRLVFHTANPPAEDLCTLKFRPWSGDRKSGPGQSRVISARGYEPSSYENKSTASK